MKQIVAAKLTPIAVIGIILAGLTAGCSAATWQGVAEGLAAAGNAAPATKLMLFGGPNHRTYLGCVSCSEYDPDSIFNSYGLHGSSFGGDSIANHYSEYGSPYSNYGACSPYATDPPVIVDGNGLFYGRLTLNRYHQQRTTNQRLLAWLAALCAD